MNANIENLLRRWRINYLAPLQRQWSIFWNWWRDELLELLPAGVRQSISSGSRRLFVQISGSDLLVFSGTIERMQEIARCPIDAEQRLAPRIAEKTEDTVLLLPPNVLLRTELTLPVATEENLREVLCFEMDQRTPFSAEQVYYDYTIIARSSEQQTIDVELFVTPCHAVDELLPSLKKLDIYPDVISARANGHRIYDINLLPAAALLRSRNRTRWANVGLATAALILFVVMIAVPIMHKRQLIASLQPKVAAAIEAAKEGTRLRQNIETIATGSQELLLRKESQPMLMQLVDEITRVIPDNTWLTRLDISAHEIQMQGQSQSAESLISLIESSPIFEGARFRSPVTQVPRSDAERFHLSAAWNEEVAQ